MQEGSFYILENVLMFRLKSCAVYISQQRNGTNLNWELTKREGFK